MSVLLLLGACGGGGGTGGGVASGGVTTITGSSGDGPIIDGAITVTDGHHNAVTTTPANPKTDLTAHYSFTISPTTPLPITVTIKGGKDKVTGAPQDFTLTSISDTPLAASGTVDLNINPLSTLIAASASAKGALNATTLAAATTNILNTMGFGLPAGFDPQSTKVGTANVASVIKANEAAAELIRRAGVATGKSMANTIIAIAEDLTDGVLDGKVAAGVTASQATVKTAGVILTKQAEISAAMLAGKLTITDKNGVTKVTAANMTSKLNAAILITQPNTTGNAADVSKVKVTQKFIDQTINAVSQSNVLLGGGNARLNNVEATIHALSATTAPSTQQAADIIIALNHANTAMTTANSNAKAGTNTSILGTAATVTNTAPAFTGTPAISGTAAVGKSLSLTATATSKTVTLSYQWNVNGGVIAGATSATYVVRAGDVGKQITAVITANDGQNAANSATSVVTAGVIVPDTTPPVLSSFTSTTTNGSYKAAATINITATYSEALAAGSALTVSLNSGKTGLVLNTISGSTITGTYTVSGGETSAGLTVSAITAQSVSDAAGNALTATTVPGTNIAAGSAIVIDTTAPTLTSVVIASNNATSTLAKAGDVVTVTFAASETLSGTPIATIATKTATVTNTGGNTYTATYTMLTADTQGAVAFAIDFTDATGNAGTQVTAVSNSSAVAFDSVAPTITSKFPVSSAPGVALDAAIDITFSEAMNTATITTSSFTVTPAVGSALSGTSVNHNAGNNESLTHANLARSTVYTVAVTNAITDAAGNALTAANWSFTTRGLAWVQEAYVKASNTGASDYFGYSVSLNADTLAVGAYWEASNQTTITNGAATASANNSLVGSGAVYVYKRTGTTWAQEAYVKASNAGVKDFFGHSVSLNADTLAVVDYGEDSNQTTITNGTGSSADNSLTDSGAVYVYKRTGTTWAQEAYVKASNAGTYDYFGHSVALNADTLAVGAFFEASNQTTITNGAATASANNSLIKSGAVYVYKRTGTTWAQEAYVKASNAGVYDYFGGSVSLNANTLAVGASYEDSNQTTITNGTTTASANNSASNAGAVYVYKRTGTTWAQEAYVKASNAGTGDLFGCSVSLKADTLAVGAYQEASNQTTITNGTTTASADNSAAGAGAVYVYKRTGTTWAQEAYVKASNAGANDRFGIPVSLNANTLAVGAYWEDSQQTTITNGTGSAADNWAIDAGAVYVYKRTGATWAQEAYVKASNAGARDNFGISVSLNANTLAVGASYEDSNQTTITNGTTTASANNSLIKSGAVYVYKRQ